MSVNFDNEMPEWKNQGTEPSADLKENGFKGGYKPPASVFNWFWSLVSRCIGEIQSKMSDMDDDISKSPETFTLLNTGWTMEADSTRRQSVTLANLSSGDKVFVSLSNNATEEQITTAMSCHLSASLSGNTLVFRVSGAPPHSIPVVVNYYGKNSTQGTSLVVIFPQMTNKYQLGLYNVDNTSDINKPISTATQKALNEKADASHTHTLSDLPKGTKDYVLTGQGSDNAPAWKELAAKYVGSGVVIGEQGGHTVGNNAVAIGEGTEASGVSSAATGYYAAAGGSYSFAHGYEADAQGECSAAFGISTIANAYQMAVGRCNKSSDGISINGTTGDVFIVGMGSPLARDNALRITAAGDCYGKSSFKASGADFAEMFEWSDGNQDDEDRRGLFVTLEGEKIRLANADDEYILGAVSAVPTITGDTHSETWKNMYLTDVYGTPLTETIEVDETTNKHGDVIPAHTETRFIVNPEYDNNQKYVSRDKRKEWAAVGLVGKLVVVDDGSCVANGFCKVADGGVATKSDTGYRVISRIDDSHIKVVIK